MHRLFAVSTLALLLAAGSTQAQAVDAASVDAAVQRVTPQVVDWRRDFHQHPELGFAETRSAAVIADHLRSLGLEVRTGVGKTGVIGVLRGARPGRVVALRADMDALPVQEATGLAFASTATGTYMGNTVPVAHACGHDMHMAMLMGAAEVLAGMKDQIAGTVVFVFQPAEEGAPPGEPKGGAALMIAEGALNDPKPEAIFGLHVVPGRPGSVFYRPEGFMAASDRVDIVLRGKQTHGAWPWRGVDVIAVAGQVIETVNTLTARTVDPTTTPTVFTIATVDAGVRYNIIPDSATLSGTLRTFDVAQRDALVARAETAIDHVAAAYGATAEFGVRQNAALVFNDPGLSAWLAPVLTEAAGAGNVNPATPPTTVAEDFSYFQQAIPGVFYHLGASPDGVDPAQSAPNHSPEFSPNEKVLPLGVKTHVLTALRFLERR
ncbi:MAG: amidohydrolase [Brevundimonas mediterranea]|jgi:amidohydrolase|uniref:amidohydrolase n=1 Tax=Brevundimonas TaxID=41275 RepID=UPI00017ED809|nr:MULTISPECIES: amidohydrolase [Brevundimonas]EDX80570.1 amidohydrolase subfamily [Brevundimonas sp. BAL3]